MIEDTILGFLDPEEIPAGSFALSEAALHKAHPGSQTVAPRLPPPADDFPTGFLGLLRHLPGTRVSAQTV